MFGWFNKRTGVGDAKLAPAERATTSSISPDAEMQAEAKEDAHKILRLFEDAVRSSSAFKPDAIDVLLRKASSAAQPFMHVNLSAVIAGPNLLTVVEKKELGLNARKKYAREFIDLFRPDELTKIEPKSFLEALYLNAFHCVARERDILRFKASGLVDRVEILPGECPSIARLKKVHPINEVPALPLASCSADFCTCCLIAKMNI